VELALCLCGLLSLATLDSPCLEKLKPRFDKDALTRSSNQARLALAILRAIDASLRARGAGSRSAYLSTQPDIENQPRVRVPELSALGFALALFLTGGLLRTDETHPPLFQCPRQ
jgi:hypothetical protein